MESPLCYLDGLIVHLSSSKLKKVKLRTLYLLGSTVIYVFSRQKHPPCPSCSVIPANRATASFTCLFLRLAADSDGSVLSLAHARAVHTCSSMEAELELKLGPSGRPWYHGHGQRHCNHAPTIENKRNRIPLYLINNRTALFSKIAPVQLSMFLVTSVTPGPNRS